MDQAEFLKEADAMLKEHEKLECEHADIKKDLKTAFRNLKRISSQLSAVIG